MHQIFVFLIMATCLAGCSVTYTTDDGRPIVLGLINWVTIEPPKRPDGSTIVSDTLLNESVIYGYESIGINFATLPDGGSFSLGYKDVSVGVFGADACYVSPQLREVFANQSSVGDPS